MKSAITKNFILGKLKHLQWLIELHSVDTKKYENPQNITKYIINYLDDGVADIRENAYVALLKFYE